MFEIEIKRQSNGHIIDRIPFSDEEDYERVLKDIVDTHGFRGVTHGRRSERRFLAGGFLLIGRQDHRPPEERAKTVVRRALEGL